MSESPSIAARLRAALAAGLARLSAGAHRLEGWTSRGTRPVALGLIAVVALALGAVMIATEGHALAGWFHGGRPHERAQGGPPPKPHGGPPMKPDGKPEGKPHGGPERRDDRSGGRPQPPAPPAPPAAPQP
jgi:hypothetical protein